MFYINRGSAVTLLAGQQKKEMNPGMSRSCLRVLQGPAITGHIQVDSWGYLWLAQASVNIQAGKSFTSSVSRQ